MAQTMTIPPLPTPRRETRVIDGAIPGWMTGLYARCGHIADRWIAYCDHHGGHEHFQSRTDARSALLVPWTWCDGCHPPCVEDRDFEPSRFYSEENRG